MSWPQCISRDALPFLLRARWSKGLARWETCWDVAVVLLQFGRSPCSCSSSVRTADPPVDDHLLKHMKFFYLLHLTYEHKKQRKNTFGGITIHVLDNCERLNENFFTASMTEIFSGLSRIFLFLALLVGF